MQNVIEFSGVSLHRPGAVPGVNRPATVAERTAAYAQAARSIGGMIAALSRTVDQIDMLYEMVPEGPMREQLKTERARLVAGRVVARQTVARLNALGTLTAVGDAAGQPLPLNV